MSRLIAYFGFRHAQIVVYMLQTTEYKARPFLTWYWHTRDFSSVIYRKELDKTRAAKLLLWAMQAGMAVQYLSAFVLLMFGITDSAYVWCAAAVLLIILCPVIWAHIVTLPLLVAHLLIVRPSQARQVDQSTEVFANHKGTVIAVAGSYGKTTVKELLLTILNKGMHVEATPANKNVAISHARFAAKLSGEEDVLIIEYGEGRPGDVEKFSQTTHPDIGVITGIAPAHLDQYGSLEAVATDIFSLSKFVPPGNLYVNAESDYLQPYKDADYKEYSRESAAGWDITDVQTSFGGTSFVMKRQNEELHLRSGLLGRHLIGPTAVAVAIGRELGLTNQQLEAGVAEVHPYEHRMNPRSVSGGWVIDDTYNGNIEGIRAGLELLVELPAKRKTYVTPGLVEQGDLTEQIHIQIGELIAGAKPDRVVLMNNSVTGHIQAGLRKGSYAGEVTVEEDPLDYYANLDQFIAADDLVMLQNDWTDNYK